MSFLRISGCIVASEILFLKIMDSSTFETLYRKHAYGKLASTTKCSKELEISQDVISNFLENLEEYKEQFNDIVYRVSQEAVSKKQKRAK